MMTAYLVALSFGGVLLAASLLLGGSDADIDSDADFDLDGDLDIDADIVPAAAGHDIAGLGSAAEALVFNPLLSLRFWTFASASFGAIGLALSLLGVDSSVHLTTATLSGFVTGYLMALLFRQLKATTVAGETGMQSLGGTEGLVLLDIRSGGRGKIRLRQAGQDLELIATSSEDATLARGTSVLVVDIQDGIAEVVAMPSSAATVSSEVAAPALTEPSPATPTKERSPS